MTGPTKIAFQAVIMSETVTVAVRVRPLNSKEKTAKCTEIHKINGKSITVTDPSRFGSSAVTITLSSPII